MGDKRTGIEGRGLLVLQLLGIPACWLIALRLRWLRGEQSSQQGKHQLQAKCLWRAPRIARGQSSAFFPTASKQTLQPVPTSPLSQMQGVVGVITQPNRWSCHFLKASKPQKCMRNIESACSRFSSRPYWTVKFFLPAQKTSAIFRVLAFLCLFPRNTSWKQIQSSSLLAN